jgi:hypothetical protein
LDEWKMSSVAMLGFALFFVVAGCVSMTRADAFAQKMRQSTDAVPLLRLLVSAAYRSWYYKLLGGMWIVVGIGLVIITFLA